MVTKARADNHSPPVIDGSVSLKIPSTAYPFILYQRTGYVRGYPVARFLRKLERIDLLHKVSVHLKSLIYRRHIRDQFSTDMRSEYESIREYLPQRADAILDIGCGVAGVDVFISEHYNHEVLITLLDKSAIDRKVYYGFKASGAFYNSLDVAREVLEMNGVAPEKILLQEAESGNTISGNDGFDLIISLISWGFHYPVPSYLRAVFDALRPGGVVILDVRKNTEGREELEKVFGNVEVISDFEKYERVAVTK